MTRTSLKNSLDKNQGVEPAEKIFDGLVRGKTVALVAPGVIESDSGTEIDAHDTVFRIKFNGRSAMPDEKFVGRRCDITSHNSELLSLAQIDPAKSQEMFKDASDLKLIVAKRGTFANSLGVPTHSMTLWPPTFLTTGTSGTLALFETCVKLPRLIKLFGFDFYTRREQYNPRLLELYRSKCFTYSVTLPSNEFEFGLSQSGSSKIALAFIAHDLKSDFLFVKNLYELSGLIDGTPEVLEILNLTADEYDMRLEEMLGDW